MSDEVDEERDELEGERDEADMTFECCDMRAPAPLCSACSAAGSFVLLAASALCACLDVSGSTLLRVVPFDDDETARRPHRSFSLHSSLNT